MITRNVIYTEYAAVIWPPSMCNDLRQFKLANRKKIYEVWTTRDADIESLSKRISDLVFWHKQALGVWYYKTISPQVSMKQTKFPHGAVWKLVLLSLF